MYVIVAVDKIRLCDQTAMQGQRRIDTADDEFFQCPAQTQQAIEKLAEAEPGLSGVETADRKSSFEEQTNATRHS